MDNWKDQISNLGRDAKNGIEELISQHPDLIQKLKDLPKDGVEKIKQLTEDAKNDPNMKKLLEYFKNGKSKNYVEFFAKKRASGLMIDK